MLSLEAALSLKDPALPSRWFVNLPDVSDPYECVVESIEANFPKITAEARATHGSVRYYPGRNEIDALSITLYETFDYSTTRYFARWRSKIVREDGSYGLPVDYKRAVYAHLYYLGSNKPVMSLLFEGCWPTDQGPLSLQYENDTGRIQINATLSVDRLRIIEQ